MTPAARVQAAIELLDEIIAAAREAAARPPTRSSPAISRPRRYAGSKDRRAVRELVYPRHPALPASRRLSGRAAMLGPGRGGSGACSPCSTARRTARRRSSPDETRPRPRRLAPAWLVRRFDPLVDAGRASGRCSSGRRSTCGSTGSSASRDEARRGSARGRADAAFADRPSPCRKASRSRRATPGARAWSRSRTRAASCSPRPARRAPGDDCASTCAPAPAARRSRSPPRWRNAGRIVATDTDRGRLSRMRAAARAGRA